MTPGSLAHVTPGELGSAVIDAVRDAVADGDFVVPIPSRVPVETTAAGDYATPLPLRLAKAAGCSAPEVAALLAKRLSRRQGVGTARVTGPGFLTITMDTPLIARIEESYGVIAVPAATWPMRPLTFDNPGFRVRFAYARASGVRRHAADLGIHEADATHQTNTKPLDDPREERLLWLLAEFPGRAEQAARQDDPRPFTRHLELIADAYHDVHEQCPALPKGDEIASGRHIARLGLARAVRIVMGNGLRMLGETPDDRL
ncbi:MAG: DALR anticodon-binding domain-containing protein [Actinoallomurus sp.]